MDPIFVTFKKALPALKRNIMLSKHTTFNIGGPAKYFLVTEKAAEISKALTIAKKHGVPFFILGGGSNVLAADKGFGGLVVKIKSGANAITLKKHKGRHLVTAAAGVDMKDLVKFSANNGLSGLQWAGGLPGTFGGAIRGNAGAFGGETKDSIVSVQILDEQLRPRVLSNRDCNFSYRSSIIKEKNWIVLAATVQLQPGNKQEIWKVAKANMQYRKDRHPLDLPNAGSIFKNADFAAFAAHWKKNLQDVVKKDPFEVVPVAYLFSQMGLKGRTVGGAMVSQKHPNFIVNSTNAKAQDVLDIIEMNKKDVKKAYGIDLEQEVQYLS